MLFNVYVLLLLLPLPLLHITTVVDISCAARRYCDPSFLSLIPLLLPPPLLLYVGSG